MGLGCKPIGKLGGAFRKLENELAKAASQSKKKKSVPEEKKD